MQLFRFIEFPYLFLHSSFCFIIRGTDLLRLFCCILVLLLTHEVYHVIDDDYDEHTVRFIQ